MPHTQGLSDPEATALALENESDAQTPAQSTIRNRSMCSEMRQNIQ